jgi:hypothetical protein
MLNSCRVLMIAGLVLVPVLAVAQETDGAAPKLVVEEKLIDAGTVPQGEVIDAEFTLSNEGAASLEVKSVRPTCGCTVVKFDQEIAPGTAGKIFAKVDTSNFSGPISKSMLVMTNDPDVPNMSLVVKALVRPYVEVLPRPLVRFNAVQGEEAEQKLTVVSAEGEDLAVTKVESPLSFLETEVRKLGKDELIQGKPEPQFEVTLRLSGDAPPGPVSGRAMIHTSNSKAPKVPVRIFGVVRALLHVTPSQVQFGAVEAKDKPGRNVIVVNNRPGVQVKVTGATIDDEVFAAEVYTIEDGKRYQVTVTVDPEAAAGSRSATMIIATDDSQFPQLKVPVSASIR